MSWGAAGVGSTIAALTYYMILGESFLQPGLPRLGGAGILSVCPASTFYTIAAVVGALLLN